MKIHKHFLLCFTVRVLLLPCLVLLVGAPAASGAPPKKREANGLEKVGNFFFKVARKLEQRGFGPDYEERDPAVIIYDSRRIEPQRETRSVQRLEPTHAARERLQPLPGSDTRALTLPVQTPQSPPRSSLSLPVPHDSGKFDKRVAPLPQAPFDPPAMPFVESSRETCESRPPAPPPSPSVTPVEPVFATPVRGRPGFVYPPGVEQDTKNMLDVREFVSGQKVRDPRSGQVFLVPPK